MNVTLGKQFVLVRDELAVDKIYKAGRETMIRYPRQKIVAEDHTRFSRYETRIVDKLLPIVRADRLAASSGRSAGRWRTTVA